MRDFVDLSLATLDRKPTRRIGCDQATLWRRCTSASAPVARTGFSCGRATTRSRACAELEARRAAGEPLPLYGVPFGVKDNIDVAGMPTTAACPTFSHVPSRSARSVELLVQAGAICLGKTNLDQFATGLSGARSPYGACSSIGNPLYVSGGSSSGSAVAVAAGHVSFALGTDTGGSGRIPAGFNGVVGIKPTVGRVSTRGLVPNCPTLDCVSIFAPSVDDGSARARRSSMASTTRIRSRAGRRSRAAIDVPAVPVRRAAPSRIANGSGCRSAPRFTMRPASGWSGLGGTPVDDRLRAISRSGTNAVRRPLDRGAACRARAVRRRQSRRAARRHAHRARRPRTTTMPRRPSPACIASPAAARGRAAVRLDRRARRADGAATVHDRGDACRSRSVSTISSGTIRISRICSTCAQSRSRTACSRAVFRWG